MNKLWKPISATEQKNKEKRYLQLFISQLGLFSHNSEKKIWISSYKLRIQRKSQNYRNSMFFLNSEFTSHKVYIGPLDLFVFWGTLLRAIRPIIMPNLPFLSNRQIRQESRLTLVDLNLKNCVLTSFCSWKKIPSDVHSCLFHAITSKEEERIDSCAAWTEALQWSIRGYWRATKQFIVWISLKNY